MNNEDQSLLKRKTQIVKRILDCFFSILFLILIYPFLYIIIGSCIKIFMPGPIMFKQKRSGKDCRVFICYKFRTLKINNNADEFVDPEIDTPRLGHFLRLTGLDEVPQFWNVLKGDMSIIGPRPHMLSHDKTYISAIPEYPLRYAVKPGITGWAQVNGLRGERELYRVRKRVEYDLWYIHHWSLLLDVKIVFQTLRIMVKRNNICLSKKS